MSGALAGFGAVAIVATIGLVPVVVWVQHWIGEHIVRSKRHEAFAKIYNVPRRHLESLSSWEKRTLAVCDETDAASKEFMAEASRIGNFRMFSNGRAGAYFLSIDQPAALRLLMARNGRNEDGDHEPGRPDLLAIRVTFWSVRRAGEIG